MVRYGGQWYAGRGGTAGPTVLGQGLRAGAGPMKVTNPWLHAAAVAAVALPDVCNLEASHQPPCPACCILHACNPSDHPNLALDLRSSSSPFPPLLHSTFCPDLPTASDRHLLPILGTPRYTRSVTACIVVPCVFTTISTVTPTTPPLNLRERAGSKAKQRANIPSSSFQLPLDSHSGVTCLHWPPCSRRGGQPSQDGRIDFVRVAYC